jgi:uncharacterized protein (TIGR02118 family)
MIIVSVLYPNGPNARFDIDYYTRTHMPMVQQRLGARLRRMAVEHGLAAGTPGSPPPLLEAFQGAFAPHAAAIMADTPNYTNTQPVIQIGELRM